MVKIIGRLRLHTANWPYVLISIFGGISAFAAYTCMYAFRKAFTAATFSNYTLFHIDLKVWLVIAQIIGYTASKFYGIRFIAGLDHTKRAKSICVLVGISWLALLGFALAPEPWSIAFMLINGFPLGMIWGLVFSYVEGRRSTEFMGSVMSASLIFASGFIKTIGRFMLSNWHITEKWMPFVVGAFFAVPLLLMVFCLEIMPPPNAEDTAVRTQRKPMTASDRQNFTSQFLPGIILTLIIYVSLTVMRDIRDNFEVEIWSGLGVKNVGIFTQIDSIISVAVLIMISLLILIRNNLKAFELIHGMIIAGCVLIGLSTLAFNLHLISPIVWMTLVGLGLYMGYIPYNAIFFERMIASYKVSGNVGFIMYISDAGGYMGSISVLLVKELGQPNISWLSFFNEGMSVVALISGIGALCSLIYFKQKAKADKLYPANISYE